MKKIFLIFLIFVAGCSGCFTKTKITIVNNSKFKILCLEACNPNKDSECQCFSQYGDKSRKYIYRDTAIKYNGKYQTILPSKIYTLGHPSWESVINDCEEEKITISLFIADSLKEFTWDEMYGQKKWIKQYRLTKHELDSMNWTIIFDGK